jgi:toxin ParE1/3/4
MRVSFTLEYLIPAQHDFDAIYDFIARDSPRRAFQFIQRLDKKISILRTFPLLGRIPRDPELEEKGYRVLVVESYLAFYKIVGSRVEVHRVIHGARDYFHLL